MAISRSCTIDMTKKSVKGKEKEKTNEAESIVEVQIPPEKLTAGQGEIRGAGWLQMKHCHGDDASTVPHPPRQENIPTKRGRGENQTNCPRDRASYCCAPRARGYETRRTRPAYICREPVKMCINRRKKGSIASCRVTPVSERLGFWGPGRRRLVKLHAHMVSCAICHRRFRAWVTAVVS